jgi:hypothetical protein
VPHRFQRGAQGEPDIFFVVNNENVHARFVATSAAQCKQQARAVRIFGNVSPPQSGWRGRRKKTGIYFDTVARFVTFATRFWKNQVNHPDRSDWKIRHGSGFFAL